MARCPAGHESQAGDYCDTCGLVIAGAAPAAASAPVAAPAAAPVPAASSGASAASAGGSGCPVCDAERNGRFCEECGYDFDLAEAMPQVAMETSASPGAEPESGPARGAQASGGAAPAGQGLDLEAELARAEAQSAPATVSGDSGVSGASGASGTAPVPEAESEVESGRLPEAEPEAAPARSAPVFSAFNGVVGGPGAAGEELSLVVDADAEYYAAQIERGDIIEAEFPFPKYPHERRFTFTEGPVRIGRASASRGLAPEIDLTGPPLDPAVSHLHAQLLRHDEGWVVVDLGSANGTRLNDAEEPLEAETEIPVKQGDRIHLGVFTTITVQ